MTRRRSRRRLLPRATTKALMRRVCNFATAPHVDPLDAEALLALLLRPALQWAGCQLPGRDGGRGFLTPSEPFREDHEHY